MIVKVSVLTTCITMMLCLSLSHAEMQKSRLEVDYGTSFKLQKFNQIANPDAEKNLQPVEGLDSTKAEGVLKGYKKQCNKSSKKESDYILTLGRGKKSNK